MAERLSMATAWCASRDERGRWIFGPLQFVGYRGLTARSYLASAQERNGGETEQRLQHWFSAVPEDHPLHAERERFPINADRRQRSTFHLVAFSRREA